jgi:hypothetical protein
MLSPPQPITWLLEVTNRLVGCRSLPALTDMAYDAIRTGLGYDRVAVILADADNEWLSCGGAHLRRGRAARRQQPEAPSARRCPGRE